MDGDFMSDLYNNIHALCEKENIKDGTLCSKVGVTRSTLSELKRGRTTSLSLKNLQKIADYFGVSISDLTGEAPEQKEKPTPSEESELDADVKAKAYTILDKLRKLPTKQQEAFLNSLDISIDAALNMMDGNGNG
jgi:transcriptional regulator with XRE-family HTH domain